MININTIYLAKLEFKCEKKELELMALDEGETLQYILRYIPVPQSSAI